MGSLSSKKGLSVVKRFSSPTLIAGEITEDIHRKYKIHELLGTGSYAIVKRCTRKFDKMEFAVKQIKKANLTPEELKTVMLEVEIMKKLEHPNIVFLVDIFESPKKVYMVLELLTGGELFDRIVRDNFFTEKAASRVMRVMTEAIAYLHSKNVVHRDLKPENVIFSSDREDAEIKITDFGLAKMDVRDNNSLKTACGTPNYVAPEVLESKPYGFPVDMWSLGVILYILLCGFPPFIANDNCQLYIRIKKGLFSFLPPYWDNISGAAKDLISQLLIVDPEKRATPAVVLSHPWIVGESALSDAPLVGARKNLEILQARARFRKSIQVIVALNRLVDSVRAGIAEDPANKSPIVPRA